jgi:hypothetical protein
LDPFKSLVFEQSPKEIQEKLMVVDDNQTPLQLFHLLVFLYDMEREKSDIYPSNTGRQISDGVTTHL